MSETTTASVYLPLPDGVRVDETPRVDWVYLRGEPLGSICLWSYSWDEVLRLTAGLSGDLLPAFAATWTDRRNEGHIRGPFPSQREALLALVAEAAG